MIVKKVGKTILGAQLTAAEQKAMEIEIRKEIARLDRENAIEFCALVLCDIRAEYGFGRERLERLFRRLWFKVNEHADRYEMDAEDETWLCLRELRDLGLDLEKIVGET